VVFRYFQFAAILLWGVVQVPAYSQLSNSAIKGTVTDATGASLTKANLELINLRTEEDRKLQVDSLGNFIFPALPPGEYEVKAVAPNFSDWKGRLTLRVGHEAVIYISMQIAKVESSIPVTNVRPVIDFESSSLGDVKEVARIEALPMQTRNFLDILNFAPGVVSNSFAGQGQGFTRVNGIPGGSIEYFIDGTTASERYTNELQRLPQALPTIQEIRVSTSNMNAEYSRAGVVDVVTKSGSNEFHGQAFELNQNSAYAAKSFHQISVPFLTRNEYGGNFSGPVWLPNLRNRKNKTFFFVDIEGIKQRSATSESYIVPLQAWKQGDFSTYTDASGHLIKIYDPLSTRYDPSTNSYVRTAFPDNVLPSTRLNAPGKKVASYLPDPNLNIPYYQGPNWQNPNARATDNRTLVTTKIDQVIGADRLSGRYTYTDETNFTPQYFLNPNEHLIGGDNAAISFTHFIDSTLVNEVRGGVQRFHAYRGPQAITPPITETLGLPTYPGTIAWPGIYFGDSWTPSGYFDGIDRDNPQDAPELSITTADTLSWTHRNHEMKFGFFYRRSNVNTYETGQPGGNYNFSGSFTALMDMEAASKGILNQPTTNTGSGLADMLLGYTDYAGLTLYPRFYTRQSDWSGFARDSWRVNRRFTLNIGLRYEYWTPFRDKRSQASDLNLKGPGGPTVVYAGSAYITNEGFPQSVLDAYTAAGMRFESAHQAGLSSTLWNMPKNNWAPRLGAAYQLNTKMVIRGGYGVYYWVIPLVSYQQNTRNNPPFSYGFNSNTDDTDSAAAELVFPVGSPTYANQSPNARTFGSTFITTNALSITKGSGWNILPWNPDYKSQMAQEWNFTLERELPFHLGSRLSYVGTHGGNLLSYDPINVPIPRLLAPAGESTAQRRAYPDFSSSDIGSMDLLRWIGYSNSNQLQAEIKWDFENGFVFQGFYTLQKTLATSEGVNNSFANLEMWPGGLTNNAPTAVRLRGIYAPDSGLATYSISFNANYELPFGHGKKFASGAGGLVNLLASGWNLSAFYYWRSGLFFSPYFSDRGSNTILAPGKNGIFPASQRQAALWFDASVQRGDLGQPYTGQTFIRRANPLENDFLNNVPRDYMTGPGFYDIDASFYKVTRIRERVKLRLEAQIFNLINHKNFGLPNNAGVINTGVGTPRVAQFQGKVEF
jgi:hypothetical protein